MTYNDEWSAQWGKLKKIENLPYINKVLTKSGLHDYGYLYSDKIPNNYYSDIFTNKVSSPYLNINKFNKEWLTPN